MSNKTKTAIRNMYATGIPSQEALADYIGTTRYYVGKVVKDLVPKALCIRHSVYTPLGFRESYIVRSALFSEMLERGVA